jgi:hypothetical protein
VSGWQSDAARHRRLEAGEEVVYPPDPWAEDVSKGRKALHWILLALFVVAFLVLAARGGI